MDYQNTSRKLWALKRIQTCYFGMSEFLKITSDIAAIAATLEIL